MPTSPLQRSRLATAVALAIGVSNLPAHAQESAEGAVMEEVVVTGIRQSLVESADFKREDKGVVDAITAEDIGAFPDTNLAEALQRVTGVSIDRARGEGQYVTVRGFGPAFNLVTLNGRQMPTTGGDDAVSRSFDFSNDESIPAG